MSRITTFRAADGKSYLCVTAKRAYGIRPGARAEPLSETVPIVDEAEYTLSKSSNAERLVADSDLFPGVKPSTDVILRGSAHAHETHASSFRVELRVGPIAKTLRVWGDRTIELSKDGTPAFSPTKPIASLPLVWDFAYGGRDEYAETKLYEPTGKGALAPKGGRPMRLGPLAYPRNPAGRGFFVDVDRERIAGTLAPNIEDPLDPVTPDRILAPTYEAWIDCPAAACFEPIDMFTFPRAVFFIPADFAAPKRELYEEKIGLVSLDEVRQRMERFNGRGDPRAFNCAPLGMAKARLSGGERVALRNLHAKYAVLEFDLPADPPKILLEPQGVPARELIPLLQTILIEPDRDRVTLTWAGLLEVAMPYPKEMVDAMRHAVVWAA